jgi:hypothetical protein
MQVFSRARDVNVLPAWVVCDVNNSGANSKYPASSKVRRCDRRKYLDANLHGTRGRGLGVATFLSPSSGDPGGVRNRLFFSVLIHVGFGSCTYLFIRYYWKKGCERWSRTISQKV